MCSKDITFNSFAIEFPGSPLPVGSSVYIHRYPLEEQAYQEIQNRGSVVRIQAPRKMGKSSLLNQIIAQAEEWTYQVACIDFQEAEEALFRNLDVFLRWFCFCLSRRLSLPPALDLYWDPDMGSKVSCTSYLEEYILQKVTVPLVLALKEVNLLLEYPSIAKDFLPLLRFWHERAKQGGSFQKLRLIIVYSTEIYVPLHIHQSPFNIGLPLKLPEFSLGEAEKLASCYGLNYLKSGQIDSLLKMVGGNPYRIAIAFYYIFSQNLELEKILEEAPTTTGIYSSHLRDLLVKIQKQPELHKVLHEILFSRTPVVLDPILSYKLHSLGLIKVQGSHVTISCDLYALYFQQQLVDANQGDKDIARLQLLEAENKRLKILVDIDHLTQVANRRSFYRYYSAHWEQSTHDNTPISIILVDLDDFKTFNDNYGHLAGDTCLYQVAQVVRAKLRPGDLVARYGGEEFIVVLPQTNAEEALCIGERIRLAIKNLAIPHSFSKVGSDVVTASLGISTCQPQGHIQMDNLIQSADQALYQAKKQGRDRVSLSSDSDQ